MGQGHVFLTEVEYKMALEYKFFPSPEQEKWEITYMLLGYDLEYSTIMLFKRSVGHTHWSML